MHLPYLKHAILNVYIEMQWNLLTHYTKVGSTPGLCFAVLIFPPLMETRTTLKICLNLKTIDDDFTY